MIETNDSWIRLGHVAMNVVAKAVPKPDRIYRGQAYWRREPNRWFTFCAVCSEPFEFKASAEVRYLSRRCQAHKMPGFRA
jgi:hypothetical protein